MAPPSQLPFFLVDSSGNPLSGQLGLLSWAQWEGTDGSTPTPPTFLEKGNGNYAFAPVFSDPDVGYYFTISTGTGAYPTCLGGYTSIRDFVIDQVKSDTQRIKMVGGQEGYTSIVPGSHQETVRDGPSPSDTILQVYNLYDRNGLPTDDDVYYRVPTLPVP